MNQIRIKSLSLLNFKGIRKLDITEFGQSTNIYGDNGTGKTTLFDASTWLLFGKDSTDRTTFEIKTLDAQNNPIPKIDHEVSAVLEINGEDVSIKRILREKWVTKRGFDTPEFSGNETLYYWNDVPVNAGEFSSKIAAVLDEKVFKLITNPMAFNGLKWQDRRQVLIDMVGGVSDADIAAGNADFETLLSKLTNKTMEEYQKQVAASLKKMKADLKAIPTRIDEVERGKPEALDFDATRKDLTEAEKKLAEIEAQINDKLKADESTVEKKREIQKRIHSLEDEIAGIDREAANAAEQKFQLQSAEADNLKGEIDKLTTEALDARRGVDLLNQRVRDKTAEISSLSRKNEALKSSYQSIKDESFNMPEGQTCCPTCKRELEAADLEAKKQELQSNFNTSKIERLNEINVSGSSNTNTIQSLKTDIQDLEKRIETDTNLVNELTTKKDELSTKLNGLDRSSFKSKTELFTEIIDANSSYKEKKGTISSLKEEIEAIKPMDVSELRKSKEGLQEVVRELNNKLQAETQIQAADKRIAELNEEQRTTAQNIAQEEREQFTIENFIKAKIETLEKGIDARFSMVKFKMFTTQINGGQTETCEALINGVPFSDANTASRINAGVDIINTLTDYYQVNAPIFIDNRESVIELIDTNSQVINLIVNESDKKLRVEGIMEVEFEESV